MKKIGPLRISLAIFTCKSCKRDFNNRLTHTCVTGMDELGVPASMRKARDAKRAAANKKRRG